MSDETRESSTDAVEFIVDDDNLGTSESTWRDSVELTSMAPLGPINASRLVVVAPHPDDEVFGAGGLMQRARSQGIAIVVIAVTDGEGSHPLLGADDARELSGRRAFETRDALRRLDCHNVSIQRLGLADGNLSSHRHELRDSLEDILRVGDLCVAPWSRDGHPDHNVCGEVSVSVGERVGVSVMSYLVWTWHWAGPGDPRVPWERCRRFRLSRLERVRKRDAVGAFRSQVESRQTAFHVQPVLPAPVLRRFWRPFEVFIDESWSEDDVD